MKNRNVKLYKASLQQWALSNWGNVWSIHRTRKEAIKCAEDATGESWSKIRGHMEVWKCRISRVDS